jgi:hypothetical protein
LIGYITLNIPVPLQSSKSYCKSNAIKCNIDPDTNKCTCDLCANGNEPKLKDGQYKCECECEDGSIHEEKKDGTCDCSCQCADGSEDTLTKYGCPCKCECKNCRYSKKTSNGGCDCPDENPAPKCFWEKTPNPFYSPLGSWIVISHPYICKLKCEPDDPPPPPPGPPGGFTDVHFTTFDRRSFDYQGVGEFTYCIDKKTDFGIQMRTYWLNNNDYVSWIAGLAVKLANSIFTVFIDKNYDSIIRLNGLKLNDTNNKIFMINDEIVLTIESIYKITIERKHHTSITITKRGKQLNIFFNVLESDKFVLTRKKFSGLCGTNDDNIHNDFKGPDGKIYTNVNEFGNSWRIYYSKDPSSSEWDWERSNFHPDDKLDERFFPIPKNKLYPVIQTRTVSQENAEAQCKKFELTDVLLEACILDLISSGDENFTKTEAYQGEICPTLCSLKGQCVAKNTCECFDGWTGSDCSQSECQYDCGQYGKCSSGLCICEFGWIGLNCSLKISCDKVNNCTDINHGICVEENKCICFEGFGGVDCNKSASCSNLNNCSNNGICASDNLCTCNSGWTSN